MAEESKTGSGGGMTKILATFGTALIMFFASVLWRSYERTSEALDKMSGRLKALEDDKTKWGTLTEIHNKTVSMEIEMGRLEGVMQGFSLSIQRSPTPATPPAFLPTPIPSPIPIPLPATKPPLKDPKDLFKQPDDFRKMQQQKYPSPNQEK